MVFGWLVPQLPIWLNAKSAAPKHSYLLLSEEKKSLEALRISGQADLWVLSSVQGQSVNDWEKCLLCVLHMCYKRKLRKIKNQPKTFKTKEQDQSPETDSSEMELHGLIDKELKITHKNAHQSEQCMNKMRIPTEIKKY